MNKIDTFLQIVSTRAKSIRGTRPTPQVAPTGLQQAEPLQGFLPWQLQYETLLTM